MNAALGSCDRMLALFSHAYFEPARWTTQEWTAAFRLANDRPGSWSRSDSTTPRRRRCWAR